MSQNNKIKDIIKRSFTPEEREQILKDNKYFHAENSDEFDMIDILVEGDIPPLATQGEKFCRAIAVGKFVRDRERGVSGMESGILRFLDTLAPELNVACMLQMGNLKMEALIEYRHKSKKK